MLSPLICLKFQEPCSPEDSAVTGEMFPFRFCYRLATVDFLVAASPPPVVQYFKHFGADTFYYVSIIPGTIRASCYFTSVG